MNTYECALCDGSGLDADGWMCDECEGTGLQGDYLDFRAAYVDAVYFAAQLGLSLTVTDRETGETVSI